MDNLIKEIINWIETLDKSIVIGIAGHGAAGKTTFAKDLVNLLGEDAINYLNTDPYIVSSTLRKSTRIDYIYQNKNHQYKMTACHPAAHHLSSLERDIQMIRDGLTLSTIQTHYSKSKLLCFKNKITIVEGMSAAFVNPDLFDLKIYFYTDSETELKRRSIRDVGERGTDIQYLRDSNEERRIQYEVFMHPYSEHFDVIFKTTGEKTCLEKAAFDFMGK